MAVESLRKAYASDEVREMIRAREKARLDYLSGLESARQEGLERGLEEGLEKGRERGLEEGLEKGRERGLEEGLEKGRERGLEEGLEKGRERGLEESLKGISKRMISQGFTVEHIHQATGADIEQIKSWTES